MEHEVWTEESGTGSVTGGLLRGEWILVMGGKGRHRGDAG